MAIQLSTCEPALTSAGPPAATVIAGRLANARTGYAVTLCSDAAAFEALASEWAELLKRAVHRNTFLTHQWIATWWALIRSASRNRQLFILVARDPTGKLCGALPLELEKIGFGPLGYRILRFAGATNEAPEHLDVIVEGNDPGQIIAALLADLATRRPQFDLIQLTDLAEDALLLPALEQWSTSAGITHQRRTWNICPYVTTVGTFETYFKTVSQKHRYKVRLFGRRLAEQHVVAFHVAQTPAEVAIAIEELFTLHAKRWTLKDDDASGFDNPVSRTFHRGVAASLAAQEGVRIFVLRCDDRAVAVCYCFLLDGRLFFYQPGWDPEFRQFHVGKILVGHALQYCFQHGIREFDFLRGTEEYKFDWTAQTRQTLAWEASVSARGRALLFAQRATQRLHIGFLSTRKRVTTRLKQSKHGAQVVDYVKHLLGGTKPMPSKPTGASMDVDAADQSDQKPK